MGVGVGLGVMTLGDGEGVAGGVAVGVARLDAEGLGLTSATPAGLPRPSVATNNATAMTATTAPAMSQRDWGMSP